MLTTLLKLKFAALLLATPPHEGPTTADEICAQYWESGSDGHAACAVGLETWRCERQGWCDPCESAPYEACDTVLPDPVWAGQQDWDWD